MKKIFIIGMIVTVFGLIFYIIRDRNQTVIYQVSATWLLTQKTQGEVHTHAQNRTDWLDLYSNEVIAENTQIRTLENSSVFFSLPDSEGLLELGPNTDIELTGTDYLEEIKYKSGAIFVSFHSNKKNKELKLSSAEFNITVHNGDIFVYQLNNKFFVNTHFGQIMVQHKDQSLEVKSGQMVQISDSHLLISEPSLKLSTPLNMDQFYIQNDKQTWIRFAWKHTGEFKSVQLWAGETIGKLSLIRDHRGVEKEFQIKLPEGAHYFQCVMVLKSGKRLESMLSKLFINQTTTIQPLLPPDLASLQLINYSLEVKFQWDNPAQLEKLFIEVSKSNTFQEITFHETIKSVNYLYVIFEKPGVYFWRVNGFPPNSSKLVLGPARQLIINP